MLLKGLLGAIAAVSLCAFVGVHYLYIVGQASQNRDLKDENVTLKARLRLVQEEIARIDKTLQRIDQFSAKIRAITQLNDQERNLAIGPLSPAPNGKLAEVLYAPGERIDYEDELIDSKLALRLIDSKLDGIENDSLRQESNLRELQEYFSDDKALLANTPSIRPTSSRLMTSTFGQRNDPYTNHHVMHKGVDFAADFGADVVAPADGVVVFVGARGSYGKTIVIDHGFGVQTHYGHLSDYKITIGQEVRRGEKIGAVGNTGRSTGSHLHYEVRVGGIPQDPDKFFLNP